MLSLLSANRNVNYVSLRKNTQVNFFKSIYDLDYFFIFSNLDFVHEMELHYIEI